MLAGVELMQWMERFGRRSVLELVIESRDMRDVLTYLKAERNFEFWKMVPFVTSDSVTFEKKTASPVIDKER